MLPGLLLILADQPGSLGLLLLLILADQPGSLGLLLLLLLLILAARSH
jgi:hypothetical protein